MPHTKRAKRYLETGTATDRVVDLTGCYGGGHYFARRDATTAALTAHAGSFFCFWMEVVMLMVYSTPATAGAGFAVRYRGFAHGASRWLELQAHITGNLWR